MHKIIERPEYVYDNLDKLSELLKERGQTQKEVSMQLGISSGLFSNWVHGEVMPLRENYNKLALYFGWRLWQ